MACKKQAKAKKKKSLVCNVCKGDAKVSRKKKCCGSNMLAKEKGSWNI